MVNRRLDNAKAAAQEFMQAFHPEREWWIVGGLLRAIWNWMVSAAGRTTR